MAEALRGFALMMNDYSESDINAIHDVILEVYWVQGFKNYSPPRDEVIAVLDAQDDQTRGLAFSWGWGDTEVRDSVYTWALEHHKLRLCEQSTKE